MTVDYDHPALQAERIVDYAAARQQILDRLPDEILADVAFLASDDAVAQAYRTLARRQAS